MSLASLIKNGWFDTQDLDLSLNDRQIKDLKNFKIVYTNKESKLYMIYIKAGTDLKNITQNDLRIYQI